MKIISFCFALLVASSATAATLIHNVSGYTLDAGELRRFSALEFDAGGVTALYADAEAAAASTAEQRIDGAGATILPGLIDAHGHITGYGRALVSVNLVGVGSEKEATVRVAQRLDTRSSGWVLGRGWNQVLWPGREFPDRSSLDALNSERPIALSRIDGHALWVNSAALTLAGIDADTPDPEGGQIVRDAAGRATGVLIDNAMDAVFAALPQATVDSTAVDQLRALHDVAAQGLTGVHDAGVSAVEVAALEQLAQHGQLPVRVYAMLDVLDAANDHYLQRGPTAMSDRRLVIRSVKISADGALGSRGAALFDDYSDSPGHRGLLLLNDDQLRHHMQRAVAAGFQVNTHAIGDLANDRVLSLYEQLMQQPGAAGLRHRVEHAQILRPEDVKRFAAGGVIASVQPTHATSDMNMAGDRLGEPRLEAAYAWKTLLASGATVAGGSDFPVEPANPFYGLHAAVTRSDREGKPLAGWLPEQKLSRAQALSLFTEQAAFAAFQENLTGRLLPGYAADFIVVRDDYFTVPEQDIWRNQVLETWVGGERVYRRAAKDKQPTGK